MTFQELENRDGVRGAAGGDGSGRARAGAGERGAGGGPGSLTRHYCQSIGRHRDTGRARRPDTRDSSL